MPLALSPELSTILANGALAAFNLEYWVSYGKASGHKSVLAQINVYL
jgi:hypothetical protein